MKSEQTESLQARSVAPAPPFPSAPEHETAPWFVAYTKPRQESLAALNLQQQDFETYLPQFKTRSPKAPARPASSQPTAAAFASAALPQQPIVIGPSTPAASCEPAAGKLEHLFPRYVFFRPGRPGQSISGVRSTRGVASLVSFGGEPARISPQTLDAVRVFEAQQHTGAVEPVCPFAPGQQVRLRRNALDGLTGLVKSVAAPRVEVLIELLGREKLVVLRHEQLELA